MKLEGMFKDMELSKDIVQSFKEVKGEEMGSLDLSVSVLTDGFWPSFPETPLNLPHSLSKAQESFKAFYQSKHSGRLLKWQNSRGHCVVKADFPKGRKEVSLSLVQTAVLLLFNDSERLSAKEIGDATGIESKELTRTLQSLALSKVRLLERVTSEGPSKKDISLGDVFRVNLSFTNPHFRIKVNAIQAKDTPEERVATTEKVFQDRVYVVDAAIVRIMKTRKSLEHELLLAELIPQLKFQSTVWVLLYAMFILNKSYLWK